MVKFLQRFALLITFLFVIIDASAQKPNIVRISTPDPDGQYNTGDTIRIEAYFDEWLTSPSHLEAILNTGDTAKLDFVVERAEDLVLPFGVPGKANWKADGVDPYNNGINCFFELRNGPNKGKIVIAGPAVNYEENPDADYMVVTHRNGKLFKTFSFNKYVHWATELSDGSIVAGGNFENYEGNTSYDCLIKFNPDFTIDHAWMNNFQKNGVSGDAGIGFTASNYNGAGLSDNCIVEDPNEPGAIYVCGTFNYPTPGVARYKADGTYDSSFRARRTSGGTYFSSSQNVASIAVDGDYIWVTGVDYSSSSNYDTWLYKLNKNDGTWASGYEPPNFQDYRYGGPMGLIVMPEEEEGGPGGIMWLGRSGPSNKNGYVTDRNGRRTNNKHVVSFQNDGSITDPLKFDTHGAFGNKVFGVDGSALLKGKLWLAYHPDGDGSPTTLLSQTIGNETYYNEGCLVVLNLDGSFSDYLNSTWSKPSNGYTGKDGFNGSLWDGMTLSTTRDGNLMLGGNFYTVVGEAARTNNEDYRGNVIVSFQRCRGYYVVSEDDNVPYLKVEEIINTDVTDMYGNKTTQNVLPTDQEGIFDQNHIISINMPHSRDEDVFVTTWQTKEGESIFIPTTGSGYNYFVDWGDGENGLPNISGPYTTNASHVYQTTGIDTVKIYCGVDANNDGVADGTGFPRICFYNAPGDEKPNNDYILSIEQWGNITWKSMAQAFHTCSKLTYNATDAPNLTEVTSMKEMFYNASLFDGDIDNWDVSTITDMRGLFAQSSFNHPIADWNVSKVTQMDGMFKETPFNKPIGNWNVGAVTTFIEMFYNASDFNQVLEDWDVRAATQMDGMFSGATSFDQNLEKWKISKLASAENMFLGATLSTENYDVLLISWWKQLSEGAAKTKVKFHGGASTWCMGESARKLLINSGWGDGVAGGSYSNTSTEAIIDGGNGCAIAPFVTQWVLPDNKQITIQRGSAHLSDPMDISWGDGSVQFGATGKPTHTFGPAYNPGDTVTIKMGGKVSMYWNSGQDSRYLVKVLQFGDIVWESMDRMFAGATNMVFVDTIDVPVMNNVKSMNSTFYGCNNFNSSLNAWDVSKVINMAGTFWATGKFNNGGESFTWGEKTANVTSFFGTFSSATAFNQDINNWNVSSATNMNNMFYGATAFNKPLNQWNTGKVETMVDMFGGATAFDQNIGGWDISALRNAATMFDWAGISTDNYDSLLIGWGKQVEAGTANAKVFFHGGNSQYCKGAAYRKLLIEKGWGDGVSGAHNSTYPDIPDGGSLAPDISSLEPLAFDIFQKEKANIQLDGVSDGINYHARALPAGDTVTVAGNSSGSIVFDMGMLDTTTSFEIWAGDEDVCQSVLDEIVTVNVHPKANLNACTVSLETFNETKITNGSDQHLVKVHVVDVVDGSAIADAQVVFNPTSGVNFDTGNTVYTDAGGFATLLISSNVAGTFTTSVDVYTYKPVVGGNEDEAKLGGAILHNSNPVEYTFSADTPVLVNSSLTWLTEGQKIAADNRKTHQFLVTLKDANNNPVAGRVVQFSATTANAGTDKVRFYWVNDKVSPNDTTFFTPGDATSGLRTNNAGQLKVYATSTKAWIDFSTTVEFDDGTGTTPFTPVTYSYVNGAVYYENCTITANPGIQKAGDNIILAITLQDRYGNPCRGDKAIFRQAKKASGDTPINDVTYDSVLGRVEGITNDNGQFSVKASSVVPGKYRTEGTTYYGGIEVTNGKYVSYEFVAANPAPGKSYVERTKNNSLADNTQFNQIVAVIIDSYGNPVTNANVKIAADPDIDWGSGLNTDHIVKTNSSGKAVFKGTSLVPGVYSTMVYVETDGSYQSIASNSGFSPSRINPVSHTFVPGEADFQNSEVEVLYSPQSADGLSEIIIKGILKDALGNPVPDGQAIFMHTDNVTVTYERGDSLETDADGNWVVAADNNGEVGIRITSTLADNYVTHCGIWRDASLVSALFAAHYTFTPGAPSGVKSKVSVVLDEQQAGSADSLKVELFDVYDNALATMQSNATVVFAATPDVAINGQPVGAEYTHSLQVGDTAVFVIPVVSNKAQEFKTIVTMGGEELLGNPAKYSFIPGLPDVTKSKVEVINNGASIDQYETITLKATLVDNLNNPVPNVNVGFQNKNVSDGWLDFGNGTDRNGVKATDANGVAMVTVTSTHIGRFDSEVAFNLSGWDTEGFAGNAILNGGKPASFYFVDKYTTVDETKNMAIRAKWYVLNDAVASSHNTTAAISSAGVEAWYLSGKYLKVPVINIMVSNTSAINTGVAGSYELSFTAVDAADYWGQGELTRSVVVSVVDKHTVFDETKELAIRAIDYSLTSEYAVVHNMPHALIDAEAQAWSLSDWAQNNLLAQTTTGAAHLAAINTGAAAVYPLDITVDNGQTLTNQVEVTVIDDAAWFVTTWEVTPGETITIPTSGTDYDVSIDWGDGSHIEEQTGAGPFSHTYANAVTQTFTIRISGTFPRIWFSHGSQKLKILTVEQWGNIQWKSMAQAFAGCSRLTIADTAGVPDLRAVSNMNEMFYNCAALNSPTLKNWDVSQVTRMNGLFWGATNFNQDLGAWTVDKVTDMKNMFNMAKNFNQDLSSWSVDNVTTMEAMFRGAEKYNNARNPMAWNTAKVASMVSMFQNAKAFDQNLGEWPIRVLANAQDMFKGAKLSVANYDSLLIGWNKQFETSNAKQMVKFHGGLSEYCEAEAARANLITYGWGDGVLDGDPADNVDPTSGIADGGSGAPIATYAFGPDVTVCLGSEVELVLSHGELDVSYQLYNKADNLPVGDPVAGNVDEVRFFVTPTATTTYYVEAFHTDFVCTTILEDEITVFTDPLSVGGTITLRDGGEPVVCAGGNYTRLELVDYIGTVERWESSLLGDFTDIAVIAMASPQLDVANLEATKSYRAVVANGTCDEVYSDTITLVVDKPSVGGLITGAETVCADANSTTLSLTAYYGSIVRWEESLSNFASDTTAISNTNESIQIDNLTETTYYRALVKSGVCDSTYSDIVAIVVDPVSVGGKIEGAGHVCYGYNSSVLRVVDHVGEVMKWQSSLSNFVSDSASVARAGNTLLVSNLKQTTYYRAVVQSGECSKTYTNTVAMVVDPPVEGGFLSPADTLCAGSSTTLNLTGYLGEIVQWEKSNTGDFDVDAELISNTSNQYTTEALTDTTYYRVKLESGVCLEDYSEVVKIVVDQPSAGGTITPADSVVLNSESIELTLNEYVGDIVRWESSATGNFATDAVEIDHNLAVYQTETLTASTWFRAIVRNGKCDEAISDIATVTVQYSDFGDAPASYGTAQHLIPLTGNNIYIGAVAPDKESDTQDSADAMGDDTNGVDDEDGLALSFETDRSNITLSNIAVTNNIGLAGYLYGWIDVNGNGQFDADTEQANTTIELGFSGTVSLTFTGFNYTIKPNNYSVRLRAGTALAKVNQPTGQAGDGEVEDHLICIYPDTISVDDAHLQICVGSTSVNLDNCVQYVPQSGKTISWTNAQGNPENKLFDASSYAAGDVVPLYYEVEESFCNNVNVTGKGKLYLELKNEIDIVSKTVSYCIEDAENINLSTVLGASAEGTWEAVTGEAGAHLAGNRFDGKAAYDSAQGGEQRFVFRFVPEPGACLLGTPELTIVLTDSF